MNGMIRVLGAAAAAVALTAGCASRISHDPARHQPQVTAAVIAQRMITTGLRHGPVNIYTAVSDPNHLLGRQHGYISAAAFRQSGAVITADDWQVKIEVFARLSDARARLRLLEAFSPPFGDGYDTLAGTALLRLKGEFTPAAARVYQAAFARAAG